MWVAKTVWGYRRRHAEFVWTDQSARPCVSLTADFQLGRVLISLHPIVHFLTASVYSPGSRYPMSNVDHQYPSPMSITNVDHQCRSPICHHVQHHRKVNINRNRTTTPPIFACRRVGGWVGGGGGATPSCTLS